jgi:AAA+ ATPase superfamily predicted ATPase
VAKSRIVGRAAEQRTLTEMIRSRRPELLALYGRRRIGKTFLVRELAQPAAGTFLEVTGTRSGAAALQRRRFREAMEKSFSPEDAIPDFPSWELALAELSDRLEQRAKERPREKIVLFFDELPWLATPRSRLLEALDYQWNTRWSRVPQVKVILCGSAASWMLRRIVRAKGGLHNRLTRQIRLEPFRLGEVREYLRARHIHLKLHETVELYMAIGGVPYYLDLLKSGESVSQAVGRLCFEHSAPLRNEFDNVFASLFDEHEGHVALLRKLARKSSGMTRNELIEATGKASGGGLNRLLDELEESGFITRVEPFAAKVKNTLFRVIDPYALFYLRWIEQAPRGVLARGGAGYWHARAQTPAYISWLGYAFEGTCLQHASEIQRELGIANLVTAVGTWRHVPREKSTERRGAQVDLLFDRRDGVINLCELKFSTEPFVVHKQYARELKEKVALFEEHTKTRKRVILTLVAPFGLKSNAWSEDLIEQVVNGDALFR